MIAEASAVLTSLKIALDIAQGIQALDSEAEVNTAVIDLQRRILQAQMEAFNEREVMATMANRIRELEQVLQKPTNGKARNHATN